MAADLETIESLLGHRPELAVLAEGVTFDCGSTFDSPFRVVSAGVVEMSPAVVRSGPALVVHVRHALEIAMWHRLAPGPRTAAAEVACAGLSCWTALQYVSTLPVTQAAAALEALPAWMRHLHRFMHETEAAGDAAGIVSELVAVGGCLLHRQRQAGAAGVSVDRNTNAEAAATIAELLEAARPVERLLTSGGDSRVCLDPVSRINKYGCSAVPEPPSVAFSSCTASSPSIEAYRTAEDERRRLLRAAAAGLPLRAAFAASVEDVRTALAAAIGLDAGTGAAILLAASGTDCELHALQLTLAGHEDTVVSIVIGPDEIGSGSLLAAGGRHFDRQSPLGGAVTPGQAVRGLPVDRVRVETVAIRDDEGRPVPLEQLDAEVATIARRAARGGARVLLHVVDGSKTGLRAPSLGVVRRLQGELGESLTVLVDAAQMRTRSETLSDYIHSGWLVMVSGSKFLMGPPFSGALLVPGGMARRAATDTRVPEGLGDYLTAFDVPRSWTGWRRLLPFTPNLGLLLRWRAALAEVEAFQGAGRDRQHARFAALADRIRAELRARPWLRPVPSRKEASASGIEDSLWTFAIARDGGPHANAVFDYDEAWQVFLMMNRDLSAALPPQATAAERQVAATRCHIGQPVRLRWRGGGEAGGLRVALGARSLQAHPDDAAHAFDKLELIRRYWPQLTARQAVA